MGDLKSIDQVLAELEPTVDRSALRSFAPPRGDERAEWWGSRGIQVVYVIQGNLGSPYKIGTARDAISRLRSLQTGSPFRLTIVDAIPGGQAVETRIHRALRAERLQGEWFQGELTNYFVAGLDAYSVAAIDHHGNHGEVLPFPDDLLPSVRRRSQKRGMKSADFGGNTLGHRWRTTTGEVHPVRVRFEKPAA